MHRGPPAPHTAHRTPHTAKSLNLNSSTQMHTKHKHTSIQAQAPAPAVPSGISGVWMWACSFFFCGESEMQSGWCGCIWGVVSFFGIEVRLGFFRSFFLCGMAASCILGRWVRTRTSGASTHEEREEHQGGRIMAMPVWVRSHVHEEARLAPLCSGSVGIRAFLFGVFSLLALCSSAVCSMQHLVV